MYVFKIFYNFFLGYQSIFVELHYRPSLFMYSSYMCVKLLRCKRKVLLLLDWPLDYIEFFLWNSFYWHPCVISMSLEKQISVTCETGPLFLQILCLWESDDAFIWKVIHFSIWSIRLVYGTRSSVLIIAYLQSSLLRFGRLINIGSLRENQQEV